MRRLVGLFLWAGLCFGQMPPPGGTPDTCEDGRLAVAIWPRDAQAASKIGKDKLVDILRPCQIGRVVNEQDVRDYRFVPLEKGRLYLVAIVPSGGTTSARIWSRFREMGSIRLSRPSF